MKKTKTNKKVKTAKKVLLFDIETAPNIGYTWGKYEQNVIKFVEQHYMLCFAYKWLGEKTTHAVGLPDFKLYSKNKKDDTEVARKLWELFDEADVIIGHNGDAFDVKKSNTFFLKAGFTPPSPYKTVDTLKQARKYFKCNSNRLNDIGEYLNLGQKVETGGFQLWEDCLAGDSKAWKLMIKYNKQDVVLLEQVYLKLLPWMATHPDIGERETCKNCNSDKLQKRGWLVNRKSKKQRYHCQDCGAWSSGNAIRFKNGEVK